MEFTTRQKELLAMESFVSRCTMDGKATAEVAELIKIGAVEEDKEVTCAGNEKRYKVIKKLEEVLVPVEEVQDAEEEEKKPFFSFLKKEEDDTDE